MKKTIKTKKPIILITNDDGIHAEGLHVLVEVASSFGEIYVVAPDIGRSASSHCITIHLPLRVNPYQGFQSKIKKAWACSGTPVDCVKLALDILPHTPDLCLSGINHGDNLSIATIYSGTVGAAIEAAIENVPSIAFSLCGIKNFNFNPCKEYIAKIIHRTLSLKHKDKNFCLNVNIPTTEKIQGIQVTRQCLGKYEEDFEVRKDPGKKNYYWLRGSFLNHENTKNDTDVFAISQDYISLTPVECMDTTNYSLLSKLKKYDL